MAVQERARGIQVNNVGSPGDVIFDNTTGGSLENLVLKLINDNAAAVEASIYIRDNAAATFTAGNFEDKVIIPAQGTKYMGIPVLIDDDHILGDVDANDFRATLYEVDP